MVPFLYIKRGIILALILLVTIIVTATGCGSIDLQPVSVPESNQPKPDDIPELVGLPTNIEIPNISAESTIIQTGLNKDNSLETPSINKPLQASWYNLSVRPGHKGPAIILGHVDGNGKKGIFYRLDELKSGDLINITRDDGSIAVFMVYLTERVAKDKFPTQKVYGNIPNSEIRLITCGGVFDRKIGHYKDNVIVYAQFNSLATGPTSPPTPLSIPGS